MDFEHNYNYFKRSLINYLLAIQDDVNSLKSENITLDTMTEIRIQQIKKYVLKMKKFPSIKGEDSNEKMNELLKNEILNVIDFQENKFQIAYQLYYELNKICQYDNF